MDLLRATVGIADVFESGKYAVMHREGEFENDVDRWNAAVKEWASGVLWKGESLSFYEEHLAGNYSLFHISEKSWRIYCAAT
jgi:hypothetical protein